MRIGIITLAKKKKKKLTKKQLLKKLAKRYQSDPMYKTKVDLRDTDGNDLRDTSGNDLQGEQWYYSPTD
tara:strand:+ start:447 stop:653 length:207 start_codon:yes stop_codon:yes gene_type:complete